MPVQGGAEKRRLTDIEFRKQQGPDKDELLFNLVHAVILSSFFFRYECSTLFITKNLTSSFQNTLKFDGASSMWVYIVPAQHTIVAQQTSSE